MNLIQTNIHPYKIRLITWGCTCSSEISTCQCCNSSPEQNCDSPEQNCHIVIHMSIMIHMSIIVILIVIHLTIIFGIHMKEECCLNRCLIKYPNRLKCISVPNTDKSIPDICHFFSTGTIFG